ncbi:Non-specific serine/threonine protein kinase [Handroanthus impetiginosus]|uniref:Non-specific serine/threonine protein kinase n=1 Tax=Handroanthus impetiginosus TaxID=429701 RepID=A0A2G9HBI6_9LAMI|nr:Non-specific serine/threonine protein kinase [Handroanthus impetiginosus]
MWKGNGVKYVNNMTLMKLINLSSDNLVGEIRSEITKLVGLVGLNFSINDNLSGSIPQYIDHMNSLNFSRNQLTGSIPTSLSELSFLGVLNLSHNNLSARIPSSNKLLTFNELSYMLN